MTPPVIEQHPPVVAVFSMAGGVGKTCLVATLGRALSALGEHVLLADTTAGGLLPFYFGSRASNPGVVRTFSPIGVERDAPVKILNLEAERYPRNGGEHDPLLAELISDGGGASRILVDLATAGRDVTGRLLVLRPTVLVPLLPDMSSVASLGSLEAFLGRDEGAAHYLLNQFDGSSPLHRDVREMLQQPLGRPPAAFGAPPQCRGERGAGRGNDGDRLRARFGDGGRLLESGRLAAQPFCAGRAWA